MNTKNINENDLMSDIELGLSKKELMVKYQCSHGTLLSHVRKYIPNFKFKKNYSNVLTKEFLETTELTILEISKKYNISKSCIHRYINAHNIQYTRNKKAVILLENKEWLFDQYVTKNKPLYQIAEELKCSDVSIKKYLQIHQIPLKIRYKERLSKKAKELAEEFIIDLYTKKNLSTEDIALKYECNSEYIRQILIKNNIDRINGRNSSSHEFFVKSILDELKIDYIPNTKKIIPPYELDIFIPEYNIAFEINGIYFHSNKFVDKNYHENKRILCEKQKIRLIQIFEDDIIYKKPIIETFIKNIFSRKEYIHARKCKITTNISIETRKDFMNNNHIQGYSKCNKSIGLEYNGELVALMLFDGNLLTRYATSKNVQGGFSKLLKNSNLSFVKTFVDLSMFSGETYFKCGFHVDKYISPDYKYVINNKRIHKFNYRKERFIIDENLQYVEGLTETELANLNKINKIYDAGKLRLIWHK